MEAPETKIGPVNRSVSEGKFLFGLNETGPAGDRRMPQAFLLEFVAGKHSDRKLQLNQRFETPTQARHLHSLFMRIP
jgi:hypothetical protein